MIDLFPYMCVLVLMMCSSMVCIVLVAHMQTSAAKRISKDITNGLSRKIERKIIHDLDTGHFDPKDGWIYSAKDEQR